MQKDAARYASQPGLELQGNLPVKPGLPSLPNLANGMPGLGGPAGLQPPQAGQLRPQITPPAPVLATQTGITRAMKTAGHQALLNELCRQAEARLPALKRAETTAAAPPTAR